MAASVKGNKESVKKNENFDLLSITESLGYKTNRKASKNYWSKEEDQKLADLVNDELLGMGLVNGIKDLKTIHDSMNYSRQIKWEKLIHAFKDKDRTPKLLRKRWISALDPNIKRGKWTPEEDQKLISAYEKHGPKWLDISSEILGRTEDQCSKRYVEVLGPSSKERLREWTLDEELSLISKVKKYGTKWRTISSEMESRPSLTCRNRWRRIITMVVRGLAPEEIMKAVKEDKNIDFGIGQFKKYKRRSKLKENGNSSNSTSQISLLTETTSDTMSYASLTSPSQDFSSSNAKDIGIEVATEMKNEDNKFNQKQRSNTNSISSQDNVREGLETRALSLFEMKQSKRPYKSASPVQVASHLKTSNVMKTAMKSPSSLTSPGSVLADSRCDTPSLEQQFAETTIDDQSKPKITTHQWKFTLKDSQDYSISNGSISNSQLVKELVEQAKKHNLKISIHQHIHNHYGSPAAKQSSQVNLNDSISRSQSVKPVADALAQHLEVSNDLSVFETPNDYGHVFNVSDNAFMATSPNYNPFGLDADTPVSNDYYSKPSNEANMSPDQRGSRISNEHGHTGTSSSAGSFSTPGSELPEGGPNRMTHFTYLPSTMKPQLESSGSTRSTNLQYLLGENGHKHKKRKRRTSRQHEVDSERALDEENKRIKLEYEKTSDDSKQTTVNGQSNYNNFYSLEEDEEDFWESLRSLADNPASPGKQDMSQSYVSAGKDNTLNAVSQTGHHLHGRGLAEINTLDSFLGNEDDEGISMGGSEDGEAFFLPLNPS